MLLLLLASLLVADAYVTPSPSCGPHGRPQGAGCSCDQNYVGNDCSIYDVAASSGHVYTGTLKTREWNFFHVAPSSSSSGIIVSLNETSSGDADIYVRQGGYPSRSDWIARDVSGSSKVSFQVDVEGTETVYVGVYGFRAVSFSLRIDVGSACPNSCSDHGTCSTRGTCSCDAGFAGEDCSVPLVPLVPDGPAVSGYVGSKAWNYYSLTVPRAPEGYASMVVEVTQTGDDGDVDAYLRFREMPSKEEWDVRDISTVNPFSLEAVEPRAGSWILGMYGFQATSFSVRVKLTQSGGNVCPNACSGPAHGTCNNGVCRCQRCFTGDQCESSSCNMDLDRAVTGVMEHGSWNYYPINVVSSNPIILTLAQQDTSEEDCDLYVKEGDKPTRVDYDYHDAGISLSSTLEVPQPDGQYWVAVYAFRKCTYTLTLSEGTANTCPNDCSGHGTCEEGQCACTQGYAGEDCSQSLETLTKGSVLSGSVSPFGWKFFKVTVSGEVAVVQLEETSEGSGGLLWLYASPQLTPSLADYDERDRSSSSFHQVTIRRSPADAKHTPTEDWYVGVYGSPNAGVGRSTSYRLVQWQPA